MTKWALNIRALDRHIFDDIKKGLKTVETRAATKKFQKVKVGDILVFACGRSRLEKKVKHVRIFKSVGAMARTIPFRKIMPSIRTIAEMRAAYYQWPGYREKLKKYGVIAFDI